MLSHLSMPKVLIFFFFSIFFLVYPFHVVNSLLSTEATKRLAVFEKKVLRRILGVVKINDIWRKINNSELMNLYEDVDNRLYHLSG